MDGPRLSSGGRPHFSSRQTRLLQPGGFVGRCPCGAVGISSQAVTAPPPETFRGCLGSPRRIRPVVGPSFFERRVSAISWSARVTAQVEPSENLPEQLEQVLEAVSHPPNRRQKSESSSDRYPAPLHARHTRGSPE